MSDVVVKYRPRSVSKVMVVIFVVLLLVPAVIALISVSIQLLHGNEGMRIGKIIKTLLFMGGVCAVIFRPASKITLDRKAGLVQHSSSWSTKAASEFPLSGLAAIRSKPIPAARSTVWYWHTETVAGGRSPSSFTTTQGIIRAWLWR